MSTGLSDLPQALFTRNRSNKHPLRTTPTLNFGLFRRKSTNRHSTHHSSSTYTPQNISSPNLTAKQHQHQHQHQHQQQQRQPYTSTSTSTDNNTHHSRPSSSMFTFGGRRSSSWARSAQANNSARSQSDALITLSHRNNQNNIVTDDELLRDGQRVSPARFSLVPVADDPPPPSSDCSSSTDDSEPSAQTNNNNNNNNFGGRKSNSFSQAGGHDGSFRIDGATLTKKVTDREASFYEAAEEGAWPANLLPKFYGRVGDDAIRIENLTHRFNRPCIIDLKMGVQTVESDEKSLFKKIKMNTLDTLTGSRSEGCRLEGLSMIRTLDNRTVNVKGSKRQTHGISADLRLSLTDVLTFFLTDESGVRTDVALRFQTAIEQLLRQFENNDRYLFIGSSILLIYDNDNQAPYMRWARALRKLHTIAPHVRLSEDQISGLTRRTLCDVRMIDFAHTGPLPPGQARDEGYITGLRSILRALKAIRVYRSKPIFSFRSAAIDMMEEQRAKRLAQEANGEVTDEERGNFTFGAVLKELTAVSHIDDL